MTENCPNRNHLQLQDAMMEQGDGDGYLSEERWYNFMFSMAVHFMAIVAAVAIQKPNKWRFGGGISVCCMLTNFFMLLTTYISKSPQVCLRVRNVLVFTAIVIVVNAIIALSLRV